MIQSFRLYENRRGSLQSCSCVFSPATQAGAIFAPPISFFSKETKRFCTPLFFFSLRKKKKSVVHGVEEKEGLLLSVCRANPVGAERLFVKPCFSCGLRPKAAAAEKSCAPILWHLSGQNLCVYAKAMLSERKAALSLKVSTCFKFRLWHIFRMRIFFSFRCRFAGKMTFVARTERHGKTAFLRCLTMYCPLSGSGAVGETHAKAFPNCTTSTD